MAKMQGRASLFLLAASLIAFSFSCAADASAAECKRKTAGYFLEYMNPDGPGRLALSLQSMPSPLTGKPGDATRGRDVLVDRQRGDCLSCHKISAVTTVADQGGIGPALDGIGGRYSEGQLRQILVDAKVYFPDAIMPSYYKSDSGEPSILNAAEVEDLIAYLKTLK
ncbi:sulfur oxidation c-type cytochrome SoxX [Rhodomicrobium vannielii]|jgi:L-cysteine S-thiosulfotransferase|nr:sulfur oxidation c-type cytochrome SoxX [Rhodomicrobium vannielii]